MPPNNERKGVAARGAAWVRTWWRALVAEMVATALLVLLGVASVIPVKDGLPPLTHPALAFGFAVVACAMAFGPTSGAHMNPAVTLAALAAGRMRAPLAVAYWGAQLLGAVAGFGALSAALGPARGQGCTALGEGVTPAAGAALEALLTGTLALACCAVWAAHDAARPDDTAPLKLGLVVAGLVYSGGEATGASLNPARSFAPALLQTYWANHWVYWVGPLGGALVAALLHRFVLSAPPPAPAPAPRALPEELPLHEKPSL